MELEPFGMGMLGALGGSGTGRLDGCHCAGPSSRFDGERARIGSVASTVATKVLGNLDVSWQL